eukprot:s677_g17.t1
MLTLIGAAFGFTLPEIPDLPDLIGIVENAVHGNFNERTVEEPRAFLPTIAEIKAMTDRERAERFHWFLCVFFLVFLCVVILGTVIMILGAELKALGPYRALDQTAPLSQRAQLRLVILSFGVTVSLSFAATLWSLQTGRLSKTLGLDWEVYLLLFCCVGASLLVQAVVAVTWLKGGDRFDATAFVMASFSSMAPFISDQYDTLKDVIFGGLCLQSEHSMMKTVGVLSWLYLLVFHGFFLWLSLGNAPKWVPGVNCAAELATSHLPVLLQAPKVQGEWSGGFWEGTLLPIIYKQVTTSKRHHLLIENVPQAVLSVFFLAIEGGSFFVAALNLVVPGVQIALTFLLFEPVLDAAAPALGKRLNRAMHNGNMVAARALWDEVQLGDDEQLLVLMLPHLTFLVNTMKRCGFMSEGLEDPEELDDEELKQVQGVGAVLAGGAKCDLDGLKIGNAGAKVLAEALKGGSTSILRLQDNDIGAEGAEVILHH